MERPPEELRLSDSYQFRVTVGNNGHRFAGELILSPQGCSLVVRGDLSDNRDATFDWYGIKEITCDGFEGAFHLYGLSGEGAIRQAVQRHPNQISYFEIRYRVSYVIFGRAYVYMPPTFIGLDIHSSSIAQWVGHTKIQDEIVGQYNNGNLFPFSGEPHIEFSQATAGLGDIFVGYSPSTQYSFETSSMSLQFPPVLGLGFEVPKSGEETIGVVKEIETLFSFLLGTPLEIDRIKLVTAIGQRAQLSLYSSRANAQGKRRSYPFFPLGLNLRIDQLGLPQMPTELFSNYFELPKANKYHFSKYLKYRSLENPEERFLGFFRLLEKLCFQKESFVPEKELAALLDRAQPFLIRYFGDKKNVQRVLNRMPGWNNSKLNTAGCITRFLKTIPSDLRERWIYTASDVEIICKLRNDLTHANEAEPTIDDMEQQAKFIEVLLVIRLLMVIGLSVETAAMIAPRLPGHGLIEPPPDLRVTTTTGS